MCYHIALPWISSGDEHPLGRLFHSASSNVYTVSIWQQDQYETKAFSEAELQQEFVSLQEKYRKAIIDKAAYTQLQDEYTSLLHQISFFSQKTFHSITARVTGKHVDPFMSNVTVYIPEAEASIPLGAPAITEEGVFVGVVHAIEGDIVSIRLLDDGQTKIGASLLNDERTIGVIEGGFGKSIRMNFIPQNEKVSAGDIVVSSGLSEYIPYGLPIGTIEAVEKEPYQPFQSAVISPLVEANRLRILSIITQKEYTP